MKPKFGFKDFLVGFYDTALAGGVGAVRFYNQIGREVSISLSVSTDICALRALHYCWVRMRVPVFHAVCFGTAVGMASLPLGYSESPDFPLFLPWHLPMRREGEPLTEWHAGPCFPHGLHWYHTD